MSAKYDFNYIIIGGGPAGLSAALSLAKAKKRVAIVEGRFYGGANLLTRDVPYSVAMDFAHTYANLSSYPELQSQDFSFNFPTIVHHQNATIRAIAIENQKILKESSMVRIAGFANFLDPHTIAVGNRKFTSSNFIIATGSRPNIANISGTESVPCLTPDNAIKLSHLPKTVLVVGGGSTGCEIATYFAELGAKVAIVEKSSRLLPCEDKEAGELIASNLANHLGITVLTNAKVVALEQNEQGKIAILHLKSHLTNNSAKNNLYEKKIRTDCIVMATGSKPNITFGLENTGVKYTDNGITVNNSFRTSVKHIYAIGDCIGGHSSTDRSEYEGILLAHNLTNKTKSNINYQGFSRVTNTNPQVVTVGHNEQDLSRLKRKAKRSIVYLSEIPAYKIYNAQNGFIKLLVDGHSYQIIGATIVAPHADLISSEIALAIRHHLTVFEIASTPHLSNTWGQAIKLAAQKIAVKPNAIKNIDKTTKRRRK